MSTSNMKLSALDKCELFLIKYLKFVPPLRGIYAMNAHLSKEIDNLYKTIESLLIVQTSLINQVKIHQTIFEKHFKVASFDDVTEIEEINKKEMN